MKRSKNVLLGALASMAILLSAGKVYAATNDIIPNDETGIPDEAFYQILLNDWDADQDGRLSKEEAENVSYIMLYDEEGQAVSSIEGIQFFSNLETLTIDETGITDISPLEGIGINYLELIGLPIEDYSVVRTLPNLKGLTLENAGLQDLEVVRGLPLTNLHVPNNKIVDLSPLKGMPLTWLTFWGNEVEDISVLEGMPLNILVFDFNNVSDISVVAGLPLTRIEAQYNKIEDISPIKDLELDMLRIAHNQITDISCLKGGRCVEHFGEIAEETPWKLAYTYNHKQSSAKCLEIAEGNEITLSQAKSVFPKSVMKLKFYHETYDEDHNQEYIKSNKTWLSTEPFKRSYAWVVGIIFAAAICVGFVVVKKRKK